MNYLERNELILKEVAQHLQTRTLLNDEQLYRSDDLQFVSIGSFYSHILGQTFYAGLKSSVSRSDSYRAQLELAYMAVIDHNLPHLTPELPQFYSFLVDKQGNGIGLIMEDFSEGDKYPVLGYLEVRNKELPYELEDLFGHRNIVLDRVPFWVEGKRRLGDFYPSSIEEEHFEQLGMGLSYREIEEYLERNTLKVDYQLKP